LVSVKKISCYCSYKKTEINFYRRLSDVITFIISQFSDEENEVEEVDYKLAGSVIYLTKKPIENVSQ